MPIPFLPDGFPLTEVTGAFYALRTPPGDVVFRLTAPIEIPGIGTVPAFAQVIDLDSDGNLSVELPVSDYPSVLVPVPYIVTERIAGSTPVQYGVVVPFRFSPVDLSDLARLSLEAIGA